MNEFEKTIKVYLDGKAAQDPAFRAKYEAAQEKKKDITACCNYIVAEVRKTKRAGFADAEIFGMALHFYDEEDLQPTAGSQSVRVIVNHEIQLSEKDKQRIQKEARENVEREERVKAEKEIRDQKEKARQREAEKERKKKEAAEAKRKAQEAEGFGFLFNDEDFK